MGRLLDTEPVTGDLGTEAYLRFKAAIRKGELRSGDRLVEKDWTEKWGMSRTPVREAIQRLESDGLVVYEPRRGLTVTRPTHQMIMELYTMREALEAKAAGLAAQHASDIEIAALREMIEREASYLDNPEKLSEINERFHSMLHLAAHNRYLLRSLQTMHDTMALLPTMLGDPQRAEQAHREHLEVIRYVTARDVVRSSQTMEAHIKSAQERRLRWLVEQGDIRAEASSS